MLVGKSSLDTILLRQIFNKPDKIREYSRSLIPEEFSHIKELQDNQLYLTCMAIRKLGLNNYKEVNITLHELLRGIRVTGYVNDVIDVSFICTLVNMDKTRLYLERL